MTGVNLNPALPQTFSIAYSPVVRAGYTAGPFTGSWTEPTLATSSSGVGLFDGAPLISRQSSGALRFSGSSSSRNFVRTRLCTRAARCLFHANRISQGTRLASRWNYQLHTLRWVPTDGGGNPACMGIELIDNTIVRGFVSTKFWRNLLAYIVSRYIVKQRLHNVAAEKRR